jgi:hypothetical protein
MRAWLALILLASPAAAGDLPTAQFLRIGAGARALGMGEAYGPVAEGAQAVYWNPAGLASLKSADLSYSHSEMMRFFHHDFLAFALPVRALGGAMGASATLYYEDPLDLVTNTNQRVGSFRTHCEAFSLAYAASFLGGEEAPPSDLDGIWVLPARGRSPGRLSLGLSAKAVLQSVYDRRASAAAADGGLLWKPRGLGGLSLSLAFRNLGTKARFISESESLPAEVCAGAAWRLSGPGGRLVAAAEGGAPLSGFAFGKLGLEYSFPVGEGAAMAARLGYKSTGRDLGALAGATAGVGLSRGALGFDFGFQPMGDLGEVYRIGLGWGF